jgi:hypothetical protein
MARRVLPPGLPLGLGFQPSSLWGPSHNGFVGLRDGHQPLRPSNVSAVEETGQPTSMT